MVDFTRRVGLGRPLTYQEADDNFEFVKEQADLAEGYALDAQGSAIAAQNAADSAQSIIDDAVEQYEFAVEDNANRIRNLEYGSGPYPSLDLNFVGATVLDPRIDFTRATTATYYDAMGVLRTAGPNEPRIDYDTATGECRGLLVEGQATNMAQWSGDFSNAAWTKRPNTTIILKLDPTCPIGETVYQMNPSDGTRAYVSQSFSANAGSVYTISRYVKFENGGERYSIYSGGFTEFSGAVIFSEASEGVLNSSVPEVSGYEYLGSGWYRIWITATSTVTGSVNLQLTWEPDPGVSVNASVGVQFEEGASPTSYIPTEGSQVTRAAENVEIREEAFTSWFNPAGGTFVFDRGEAPYTGTRLTLTLGKDSSRYLGLDYSPTVVGYFQPFSGGGIGANNADLSDPHRYAISWEVLGPNAVQVAVARDGFLLANNTYQGDTSTINEWDVLQLGQRFGAFRAAQLYVKRLSYYPRALSDAQLIALTS